MAEKLYPMAMLLEQEGFRTQERRKRLYVLPALRGVVRKEGGEMNRILYCIARLLWKLKADNYRWIKLIFLSVFLGIYTAEMIVYMPDWIKELTDSLKIAALMSLK
jgi:hypothetical protein